MRNDKALDKIATKLNQVYDLLRSLEISASARRGITRGNRDDFLLRTDDLRDDIEYYLE